MTNSNFYNYDSATERVVNSVLGLMKEGRYQEAINAIQKYRDAGLDTLDFHIFTVGAYYDLGLDDDVIQEGSKALFLIMLNNRADGEQVQLLSAEEEITSIMVNSYLNQKNYEMAEYNVNRLLQLMPLDLSNELARIKAVAATARYYIETGRVEEGELLIHNCLSSCNHKDWAIKCFHNCYIYVADSFLTSLPNDETKLYINTQKDLENRIYWFKRACDICPPEEKRQAITVLNTEKKNQNMILEPGSYAIYFLLAEAVLSIGGMFYIIISGEVATALKMLPTVLLLVVMALALVLLSLKPRWKHNKAKITGKYDFAHYINKVINILMFFPIWILGVIGSELNKSARYNPYRNGYVPSTASASPANNDWLEDMREREERERLQRQEESYQQMQYETELRQAQEAAAQAYAYAMDTQRVEYERSFYENNNGYDYY